MITNRSTLPTVIQLTYVNVAPLYGSTSAAFTEMYVNMSASVTDGSTYLFTGVSVRSQFGRQVQLRFSADGVQVPITVELPQEACTASEYAVSGSFSCAPCPANADCDGSSKVVSHRGYWRSSLNSVVMYECTPADACPASVSCAPGYTGAVCGSCAAGYGMSGTSCALCASQTANWLVTVAIMICLGALVYLLSIHTVVFTAVEDLAVGLAEEIHDDAHFVSVVVKLVISHLQTLALIPVKSLRIPEWVVDVFIRTPSFKPNISYVACAVGGSPYHQMASQLALIPILLVGLAMAAFVRAFVAHRNYLSNAYLAQAQMRFRNAQQVDMSSRVRFRLVDHASIAVAAPLTSFEEQRSVQDSHADLLEWYDGEMPPGDSSATTDIPPPPPIYVRMLNLCAVTIIVVLFFVYPTLVQTSMQALRCRSIDIGVGLGSYSVLAADPQTHCADSDETYTATRSLAIVVIVFVGVGVLFAAPAIIARTSVLTCKSNKQHTNQLFFFVTGGYRLWYWESVAMGRKAAIALALALADDGQQQFIAALLVSMIFSLGTIGLQPWRHALCANLDALGQLVGVLTFLCLGLGYTTTISASQTRTTLILVLILIFNLMFLLYAVLTAFEAVRIRLRYEAPTSRLAEELLDRLEGRAVATMQQTLEDLRGQVVAHEQMYHARVATFRALLLKEASVQFKEDAAIVKSRTQSVYGSIYALRRASSAQSSPSQHNKGRLHETSTTVSSPVAAMQLPMFNSDVAEHELSFTVRSSPRSMRKGRHSQSEASSPVVALRKERRQSHMSLKDRQADGESDGGWAVRSTKSIRILLDEDVEPTSTHTHVQPLGGEASPSPSTAAVACDEGESSPLRHDSPRVATTLSDMTVTDVGDDDDDRVVVELTSATHNSPTLHQPPQHPQAESSTDCVPPRQAIALPTEHNLLMLHDDVTTSQQQARSDAPQHVAGASAMKYVVDYDDIEDHHCDNNFTAQDTDSTAHHHSVAMMDIPIDAQYVDIDHLVEDTDQSRCDPRYVPAYDADAAPLQAPQPPPLTQGCTHTLTAHDPPQKFPNEGDFDDLVETANASTLFENKRRNDLSVCDIEDEDVELLAASSSAFGPTYKSAAAWGDGDVQQAASPHSSMSTNSVRPPPRTSILVSRDHGAVGSPKKRHSGGGSEIDLEWSMSATPVESPSHAMRSVKKKPDTSTNTMILRDILFD
ncbi:transmembrane protein, putative, partial [Bodo saltans]